MVKRLATAVLIAGVASAARAEYDPWGSEAPASKAAEKAVALGSSTAILAPISDTAPDGDGRTGFPTVTLSGRTAASATVTCAGLNATADAVGGWSIAAVPLVLGSNQISVDFSDGSSTATRVVGIVRLTAVADGDGVLDWNAEALDVIRKERQFPPPATRLLAIQHLAMQEAAAKLPSDSDAEVAACAASHRVLTRLFAAQKPELDARLALSLSQFTASAARDAAVAAGVASADRWIAQRSTDGAGAVPTYQPGTDPGNWRPTYPTFRPALLPQWAAVRPFTMTSPNQFRPPGPPSIGGAEYAANANEVWALGEYFSTTRTPDETAIAQFWADQTGTASPPGHWDRIAATVALQRGDGLRRNLRLFTYLNSALADAAIACWEAKYHYDFWRPITAVTLADQDGNDATAPNALWTPYITTPPFPEYPSGHSTFSGAAAEVLSRWWGEDVEFTDTSDIMEIQFGIPDFERHFPNFRAAAIEASRSRVLGGIHYTFSCHDGLETGTAIAAWTMAAPLPGDLGDAWMIF